jgi:hypothetical protein
MYSRSIQAWNWMTACPFSLSGCGRGLIVLVFGGSGSMT